MQHVLKFYEWLSGRSLGRAHHLRRRRHGWGLQAALPKAKFDRRAAPVEGFAKGSFT